MNALCCLIFEGSRLSIATILDVGLVTLFLNALIAFCLNVSVVFLVRPVSNLVVPNLRLEKHRHWS
jgi:hypothetical protein